MKNRNNNSQPEVLIVGAGPTGLMAACQLAIQKISFRIIDRNERPSAYSGALFIQARTLEIFDQMGIIDKVLRKGKIAREVFLFYNGKKILRINIEKMGRGISKYPFIFMLKQTYTEEILMEFLGHHGYFVERQSELLHLTENTKGIEAEIMHPEDKRETVKAKYLIGADGGKSSVREMLGIPMRGKTNELPLFVLDCIAEVHIHLSKLKKIKLDSEESQLVFSISTQSIAGLFPFENNTWRIDSVVPEKLRHLKNIQFEDVKKGFSERVRMDVKLLRSQWFSVFYSHKKIADIFRQNQCFLVGDAAHIHSPIGAQGMNTGLQDAFNLTWKLAFVIKYGSPVSLLDTYQSERKPIAQRLIHSTDRFFNLAINDDLLTKMLRIVILPLIIMIIAPLLRLKNLKQAFFRSISETDVHYRNSSLSLFNAPFNSKGPKPGDRLPFFSWIDENGKKHIIQDIITGTKFHLLHFDKQNREIKKNDFKSLHKDMLQVVIINYHKDSERFYKQMGVKQAGYYLVRPDGYIALRSSELDLTYLHQYLHQFGS